MSNTTQDKLYETFNAVAGGQTSSLDPFIDASQELASSVGDIAKVMGSTVGMGTVAAGPEPAGQPAPGAVSDLVAMVVPPSGSPASSAPDEASADSLPAVNNPGVNVPPVTPTSSTDTSTSLTSSVLASVFGSVPLAGAVAGAATGSSGSSASSSGGGTSLESIASTVLESGLGLVPLIGSLIGLFGGGDSSTPALEKYTMPATLGYEGADTGSGISGSDFDQMGNARSYGDSSGGGSSGGSSSGSTASGSSASPQITVNVQAMDARSFMDRSSDIAAAVRDAMLNLSSINDVVSEL